LVKEFCHVITIRVLPAWEKMNHEVHEDGSRDVEGLLFFVVFVSFMVVS